MITKANYVKFTRFVLNVSDEAKTRFFFRSMYNKAIIRLGFCDIQNKEGLSKRFQPRLRLVTSTLILITLDMTENLIQ